MPCHGERRRQRCDQTKARVSFGGIRRYENPGAFAAIALSLSPESETGLVVSDKVVAAVDSGQAVNPGGIRNQVEGGIVQCLSWTQFERVSFDRRRIISRDWSGYTIMRFSMLPKSIDVHIVNGPGLPFLGTGEASQGPASAAFASALARATGRRTASIPLLRKDIRPNALQAGKA